MDCVMTKPIDNRQYGRMVQQYATMPDCPERPKLLRRIERYEKRHKLLPQHSAFWAKCAAVRYCVEATPAENELLWQLNEYRRRVGEPSATWPWPSTGDVHHIRIGTTPSGVSLHLEVVFQQIDGVEVAFYYPFGRVISWMETEQWVKKNLLPRSTYLTADLYRTDADGFNACLAFVRKVRDDEARKAAVTNKETTNE